MRKKKRKIIKNNQKKNEIMPEAMPEVAYNFNPDDVEIGDDLTISDMKKNELFKNSERSPKKEDH